MVEPSTQIGAAPREEETQSKRRLKSLHPVASNRHSPPRLDYHTWCKGVHGAHLVSRHLGNSRSLYIVCLCLHVFSSFGWEDGRDTIYQSHYIMVSDGTDGQVPGVKSPAWERERTTKEATAEQLGVSQSNPPGTCSSRP